jgi:RNA recognition motif-containing protein
MATNLFVGSLPYSVDDAQLQELFAAVGNVVSAKVIMDRESGRSKGFGFVEMGSDEEAKAAIEQLDGKEVSGRAIAVKEAQPREDRGERRSFGGNGGGRPQNRGGFGDRRY